jgi:UDP-N-acetylmuramate: L-alanyl-gamma-D-glutamyl-meso-diaminopimelate ligase
MAAGLDRIGGILHRSIEVHLHILGICGTFMGGLALVARSAGHRVTGCDANVYPPMSTQLEAEGIELIEGYAAEQIDLAPDVFVVGNAISRGNPLLEEILDRGLPYASGPQWLADRVLKDKWVLAVAGTHGKTTTSAMLAWILESAGLGPGFLIGGVPADFGVSARLSDSPHFVIEADEYDTAFSDKRSKFVHYRPRTAVLNNLEFDHADIFPDLAAIETQFHHFVRVVPRAGLIVANAADPNVARVLGQGCWTPVERFNAADGWTLGDAASGESAVLFRGAPVCRLDLEMPGAHNRSNALAAIAAAHHVGVAPEASARALARFGGVRRRLETRGSVGGVTVYDDFAHHPTAIAATIAGLRARVGRDRILAILEPRSNTMKLGIMKDRLAGSLDGADRVYCSAAGLGWDAKEALSPLGERAESFDRVEDIVRAVVRAARPRDHLLVMSNGSFGGIHERLLRALADRV